MARKRLESELAMANGTLVPILAPGIGTRIKEAVEAIGTRRAAAAAAGISPDMLYRYMREDSPPSFTAMAGLCRKSGHSLDWMATGEGSPHVGAEPAPPEAPSKLGRPDADLDAMEEVIIKVRAMLREKRPDLSLKAEARIIRLVYEFYMKQGESMDTGTLDNVIELAAFR